MLHNYLVYSCTYVYLRVLNQYGTHWNKNTPTTAMIRTVGQLNSRDQSHAIFEGAHIGFEFT